MPAIQTTDEFDAWLESFRDKATKGRIAARLARLEGGNFGDAKSVGDGVSELRLDFGSGYRAYYMKQGLVLVILLCGGDKSTQTADIKAAKALAAQIEEQLK